jgi:hypothetical protein
VNRIRIPNSGKFALVLMIGLGVACMGTQADAKTITISYTGAAPAGAEITVSASGENTVLGSPAHPNYGQTFDISGLTSAQAISYVLTGKAAGKPNKVGMVGYGTNAAANAAGTGITVTTINAIGIIGTRTVAVTEVDVKPNDAAKKATGSSFAIAALDPTIKNPAGVPQNVALLSVDPGFVGGGPGGTDGAGAGALSLNVNGVAVTDAIITGETAEQAADGLYTALIDDGFKLNAPDPFGNLELKFSDLANYTLIGSPSMISRDFGFSATADNLDLALDTYAPEPTSLSLVAPALLGLLTLRRRRPNRS